MNVLLLTEWFVGFPQAVCMSVCVCVTLYFLFDPVCVCTNSNGKRNQEVNNSIKGGRSNN